MAERVLVVDDDADWRESLKVFLEDAGYSVDAVDGVTAARKSLAKKRYGLVLSDICLTPSNDDDYDPFELLCSFMRLRHPDIPLVAISGKPIEPVFMWGLREHGVSAFVSKRGRFAAGLLRLVDSLTCKHKTAVESPMDVKILFVAASPNKAGRLRLGTEYAAVRAALEQAPNAERFVLHHEPATRPADLTRAMLKFKPEILHFAGHGQPDGGVFLEDDAGRPMPVPGPALAELFAQFADSLRCVVLNTCYAGAQAEAMARHVNVIGVEGAIKDKASIAFSVGLYQAIGAGRSLTEAYKIGDWLARLEQGELKSVLINKK